MNFLRQLPIPKDIKEQFPISDKCAAIKAERDEMIADVFTGRSDKFLLIIGPCSADNETSVMDYIGRLVGLQDKVKDKIIIIPASTPTNRARRAKATRAWRRSPIPPRSLICSKD